MTERFAIYYAPARDAVLTRRAESWLGRPELQSLTAAARRYGFHATLKAPMVLAQSRAAFEDALGAFASRTAPVELELAPALIDGFLALIASPQPELVTALAAKVVEEFEPFRAPLGQAERNRRMLARLTPRQVELLNRHGYPYVLEEFRFHMTLTDRLPDDRRAPLLAEASGWFADCLAEPVLLDRLALFHEPAPGAPFARLGDYLLRGTG